MLAVIQVENNKEVLFMKRCSVLIFTLFFVVLILASCGGQEEEFTSKEPDSAETSLSLTQEETTAEEYTLQYTEKDITGFTTDHDGSLCVRTVDGGLFGIVHGADSEISDYPRSSNLVVSPDKLYLYSFEGRMLIQPFSEYSCPKTSAFSASPIKAIGNKLYVIIERTKLVLLDKNGEIEKTIFSCEEGSQIKDFLIADKVIWMFANGSVYKVNKDSHETEEVYSGIDPIEFRCFGESISDNEIQWVEYGKTFWDEAEKRGLMRNSTNYGTEEDPDALYHLGFELKDVPIYINHYYNSETDSHIYREKYPLIDPPSNEKKEWWLTSE